MEPRQRQAPPPPSTSTTTTSTTTTNKIILGKYQQGRLLGKGSFAKVYHAQSVTTTTTTANKTSTTSFAIKVIEKPKSPELSAAMEPRILHEISAMHRLKPHPNILQIHEVMATKSRIYLVMDLAINGDLSTRISQRGRFTEPTARRYFHQLISALHFCHRNGVAHRDIKPQNLLLDHNGTLKISDFGLSALPDLHRTSGDLLLHTACGTPAYAAPEVFRRGGEGYDGAKADAWSCGVILFLFLAGYLPFDDSNLAAMYKKICRREYQFPNWVSGRAKLIISQLLDPNPNTRMSIEALVGHVWFRKSQSLPAHFVIGPIVECNKFAKSTTGMNAFDIISMSSGLDLSGLFETTSGGDRERRFTAKGSVEVVEERVEEVGGRLGYRVERELMKGGRGLGLLLKGRVVLVFEIMMVAMELVMVVVKVVDGVEFDHGIHWEELRVGFEDLALSWDNVGQ